MDEAAAVLEAVRERIARACARAGRASSEVTLLGAGKTVPAARLRAFIAAGLTDIGENYVQEGIAKIEALGRGGVRWHLIGALQSNKARLVVWAFDVIHSVDRLALAVALDKAAREAGKVQEVLLQVNTGGEAGKAGCAPDELPALSAACAALPNLAVRGLMALPPYCAEPEAVRPHFRMLREARDALRGTAPGMVHLRHLSMGMSHDFEVAIEEGATIVRLGTALFGERVKSA